MISVGFALGLCAYLLLLVARSIVRVDEGSVAVRTTFGAAEHEVGPAPALRLLRPGLHFKWPWQRVLYVSTKEQHLDLSGEQGGLTAMADDGTVLRFDSVLRYEPVDANLEQFLFGMQKPLEHITSLFTCLLRNEIANFESVAAAKEIERTGAELDLPAEAGSYALIRRERNTLNERIADFTNREIGSRYGVRFHAVDLTDVLPPDELAEALNVVISAQSVADAEYFDAEGERQKRVLAAREGVDIARRLADAEAVEIERLASYLNDLETRGVLSDYVARRRSEVLSESRAVFVNDRSVS